MNWLNVLVSAVCLAVPVGATAMLWGCCKVSSSYNRVAEPGKMAATIADVIAAVRDLFNEPEKSDDDFLAYVVWNHTAWPFTTDIDFLRGQVADYVKETTKL